MLTGVVTTSWTEPECVRPLDEKLKKGRKLFASCGFTRKCYNKRKINRNLGASRGPFLNPPLSFYRNRTGGIETLVKREAKPAWVPDPLLVVTQNEPRRMDREMPPDPGHGRSLGKRDSFCPRQRKIRICAGGRSIQPPAACGPGIPVLTGT